MHLRILLVEDEPIKRQTLGDTLRDEGHHVDVCGRGDTAIRMLESASYDLVILDLKLPGVDGMGVLRWMRGHQIATAAIVMTAYGTVSTAVEAMKLGAHDYLTKPFLDEALLVKIQKLGQYLKLVKEHNALKRSHRDDEGSPPLIGNSPPMQEVHRLIDLVAPTDSSVLLVGESGTGKELAANTIHARSHLADQPFIKVNCAVLSPTLLESELFGHERGAFTGAIQRKRGRFELAANGSILLDDIDDLEPSLQIKLLRFLQEGEFERVGGTSTLKVKVRVIAATKVNLEELVHQGKFRDDLYYRLNIFPIHLPPLRERKDDIPLLVAHLMDKLARRLGRSPVEVSPEALDVLMRHSWPGNVRELENALERAFILCQSKRIEAYHLAFLLDPQQQLRDLPGQKTITIPHSAATLREQMAWVERQLIADALRECEGNKSQAAQRLGIPRTTLNERLNRLDMRGDEFRTG